MTDSPLRVAVVAGRDHAAMSLLDALEAFAHASRLELEVAQVRAQAINVLDRPWHVLVLSGHGYRSQEGRWLLGGRTPRTALLTDSDLPQVLPAQLTILDTCGVDLLLPWIRRATPADATVAYGSEADWEDTGTVFTGQHPRVSAFLGAALYGDLPVGPAVEPSVRHSGLELRRLWEQAQAAVFTSGAGTSRYRVWPPAPPAGGAP